MKSLDVRLTTQSFFTTLVLTSASSGNQGLGTSHSQPNSNLIKLWPGLQKVGLYLHTKSPPVSSRSPLWQLQRLLSKPLPQSWLKLIAQAPASAQICLILYILKFSSIKSQTPEFEPQKDHDHVIRDGVISSSSENFSQFQFGHWWNRDDVGCGGTYA